MSDFILPPEEEIVRALTEAHWDKEHNRFSKAAFYSHNVSVSRLKISPLAALIELFRDNFPALLKVGQINVGRLQELGRTHTSPAEIQVIEDSRDDNPAHAIIPGRMSKTLARRVVANLHFHDP